MTWHDDPPLRWSLGNDSVTYGQVIKDNDGKYKGFCYVTEELVNSLGRFDSPDEAKLVVETAVKKALQ